MLSSKQYGEQDPMKKLGLALGGGGARGSAHIGALRELFALGLQPDLVTGTSIGGLVGALLCAGFTLDEMETFLRSFKPSSMYSLPDNEPSIASTVNIEKALVRRFADHYTERFESRENKRPQFEDLDIPLAVVATDLVTQREIVLDSGDLITAIRASISIPVLFPPVQIGDWQLVDGGLMNNLPFDIARARGATHTIAIDLGNAAPYGTPVENPQPRGFFGTRLNNMLDGNLFDRALYQATRDPLWAVVTAITDIVNSQNVSLRLAISPPDVLIRPHIGTIGLLDFHTVDDGLEAGRLAVHRKAPELERLLTSLSHLDLPETIDPSER
jgi:NTE family protein